MLEDRKMDVEKKLRGANVNEIFRSITERSLNRYTRLNNNFIMHFDSVREHVHRLHSVRAYEFFVSHKKMENVY